MNTQKSYPLPVLPLPLAFTKGSRKPYSYLDMDLKWRYWRASFVGAATCYQGVYPQRQHWIEELVGVAQSRVRVGLFDNETYPLKAINPEDPKRLAHPFLGPGFYNILMQLSHVCLAPAGNAKWSYRHYQAIQAGCVLLSTELRHIQMLIPLPTNGIVYVPDHAPVWPVLAPVLDCISRYQSEVRENQHALSQYIEDGRYSAYKPLPLFLFLAQLERVVGSRC